MKQFIITVAFIILAVFLVDSFILGESGTMKSEADRFGNEMIDDLSTLKGN